MYIIFEIKCISMITKMSTNYNNAIIFFVDFSNNLSTIIEVISERSWALIMFKLSCS